MKRRWAILALALPLLAYLLAVVKAEHHIAHGETYTFAITGYDPRDILRGHYLLFQIDYHWADEPGSCSTKVEAEAGGECCYCLMKTEGAIPEVYHASCEEARSQCDGALRRAAAEELHRYYVPEEKAKDAEELVRASWAEGNAFIDVSISEDGEAQILDLRIGDHSLNEMLDIQ